MMTAMKSMKHLEANSKRKTNAGFFFCRQSSNQIARQETDDESGFNQDVDISGDNPQIGIGIILNVTEPFRILALTDQVHLEHTIRGYLLSAYLFCAFI